MQASINAGEGAIDAHRHVPRLARGGRPGRADDYTTDVGEGMVVLDAVHAMQATQAPDLACRWNCKAGKCGSCSAEINGQPRLMCMTRINQLPGGEPITVEPMHAFPHLRDLVTDVSWNYEVKKKIKEFKPRKPDAPDGTWRMEQADIDRVQEFRKCIECSSARTCATCCAITTSTRSSSARGFSSTRPRSRCTRSTPMTASRELKDAFGHRLLQHHEVLHEGLPRAHHDHRQRDHPAQGARRRSVLRSGDASCCG